MLYALNHDFLLFVCGNSIEAVILDWLLLYTKKTCSSYLSSLLEETNARTLTVFVKIKKDLVSTHSQKLGLPITQDLNKIKKIPNTLL